MHNGISTRCECGHWTFRQTRLCPLETCYQRAMLQYFDAPALWRTPARNSYSPCIDSGNSENSMLTPMLKSPAFEKLPFECPKLQLPFENELENREVIHENQESQYKLSDLLSTLMPVSLNTDDKINE